MQLMKIMEEINETIERYGKNPYIDEKVTDLCYGLNIAKDIIRKHMNDDWTPVEENLPKEHLTMFAKLKGTPSWTNAMFEKESEEVVVTIEVDKGRKVVTHARTYDGQWGCDLLRWNNTYRVTAWMPLPEPYKGREGGQNDNH